MANRNTHPTASLDRATVTLFGEVTFGASGAVSSQDSLGFTVTKPAGTGLYRITLDDKWSACAFIGLVADNATTAADVKWQVSDNGVPSTQIIDIQHVSGASAANATSGHKLMIQLVMRNSSAPRKGSS